MNQPAKRQVLIVDGPHRGELVDYDGRERFALVRSRPYDPLNPPAYDEAVFEQVEYQVRELVMFSRSMLVASRGRLGELDLIDLIITDAGKKAIWP